MAGMKLKMPVFSSEEERLAYEKYVDKSTSVYRARARKMYSHVDADDGLRDVVFKNNIRFDGLDVGPFGVVK